MFANVIKDSLNFSISLTHSKIMKYKFVQNISYPYSTEHWNVQLFPNYLFIYLFKYFLIDHLLYSAQCQAWTQFQQSMSPLELTSQGLMDTTRVFWTIRWGRILQVLNGLVQMTSSRVWRKVTIWFWATIFKEVCWEPPCLASEAVTPHG